MLQTTDDVSASHIVTLKKQLQDLFKQQSLHATELWVGQQHYYQSAVN